MVAVTQKLACLTIDMEPDLRCPERRIRLLEDDARLERFAGFLSREAVPLTSFTVMSDAPRYADHLNALAGRANLEFAVHSYSHDTRNPASDEEVRRSVETFGELWNAQPQGYRAPNCLIDAEGLDVLTKHGFRYDSSIVPSVRPDAYAYNNTRFGRMPFRFAGPSGELLELPVACLSGMRLPLVFSYVKLLGLAAYRAAMAAFPLPDVVVTYLHPYDLYAGELLQYVPGWKRYAHARNAGRAFTILERLVRLLKAKGYTFVLMRDLAERYARESVPVHQMLRGAASVCQ